MQQQTTTVREFLRNYKKFSNADKATIISNHGKNEGVYVPYEEWEKLHKVERQGEQTERRKVNIKDLEKYMFNSGYTNLSECVDEIVYGTKGKSKLKKKK
ncbi:MAG: hypothetical protein AAB373_04390 [Patescibacteria group bacterium]